MPPYYAAEEEEAEELADHGLRWEGENLLVSEADVLAGDRLDLIAMVIYRMGIERPYHIMLRCPGALVHFDRSHHGRRLVSYGIQREGEEYVPVLGVELEGIDFDDQLEAWEAQQEGAAAAAAAPEEVEVEVAPAAAPEEGAVC